ncbi:MAG: Gfo/Idh/MocA family oxidoreductase [Verrucomicrobiales bacterium]|nr:Gfo/Idh/MocA family oxidoreductase [Verrucomicrobiales bacterium]
MKPIPAWLPTVLLLALSALTSSRAAAADLRVGVIGLDTSHSTAFTKILHDSQAKDFVPGARVVAAYKGGSRDIESSWSRVEEYTKELKEKWGVTICDSIEEMCRQVDVVLLESVDGRPHLEQARPVIAAGKPLYIDKPMAASLKDAAEIFRLARAARVPVFSSSSLRYGKATQAVRQGSLGKVLSAETFSPCHLDPTHPDLFWYGIHGVESLFTLMGTGCLSVKRGTTTEGKIEVRGVWTGDRPGVYREREGYGGLARGEKGESPAGAFDGYGPLVVEIVKFFQTRVAPVSVRETLEIMAFMEAADESKRRGGAAVTLKEMFERAGVREEEMR